MKKTKAHNCTYEQKVSRNSLSAHGMVMLIAFWPFLFKAISTLPGFLGYLKYLLDGIMILLMVLSFKRQKLVIRRDMLVPVWLVVCFFAYTLLGNLLQYQSIAYFWWGFRNNFRFYIAFFLFVAYLDETDVDNWLNAIDALFWISVVLSTIQFVTLGIKGDYLGGIFGIEKGTNGYTSLFFGIVVAKSLLGAFNGVESTYYCIAKCVASLAVAAMAEIKFYYFMFLMYLLLAAIVTRFSVKKLIIIIIAVVAVLVGVTLLVSWFGFDGFFSLEGLWEYATKENYSSQGDINRLSAIPTLSKMIMKNPLNRIFGLGLGNCDTSAFSICNTPFFRQYGYLHYTWFTSAMIFLETGYVGLGLYIAFIVSCFLRAYRQYKSATGNILYNQLAMLVSILCCIIIFYNSALRIESGYMAYFVLSFPYIVGNRRHQDRITREVDC